MIKKQYKRNILKNGEIMKILQCLSGLLTGMAGSLLFMFIVLIVSGQLVDKNKLYDKDSKFYRFLLYYSTVILYVAARVKVEVRGEELIPKEGQFLLVTNHRSNFDPISCWMALRHRTNLVYISKPENFKIPFFGRIIRRCCFMPIDRQNPRNAKPTIDRAAEFIKSGKFSVGVYPEGTRSRTCKLLPFHSMVFRIAKQANVPILAAVLEDTEKVHKNFPLKGTHIKLTYIDLISAEEVQAMKTNEISARVREKMLKALNETDSFDKNSAV